MNKEEAKEFLSHYICCCLYGISPFDCDYAECEFGIAIRTLCNEEKPHGKWIEHQDCRGDTYYTCSCCDEEWTTIEGDPMDNLMNFCPNCGADMREADND